MIEHYDSSGRLEIRETMHSTDRSKVYLRTAFYADGSSIQTMYAPSGEAVLKTSIDANGHEEIVYSRAQERLRRRIEEAKDNKYFPKESIDWELLMSDKDGMQLADDLLFYIEDRKRQDEELPSLDKKQNENARKRSQAKLREAKKKALAKQEELQKRRGQAGNVAFSAAMSGKGRVSERFSLNGDVVSAIDAVAPVAIVGELPDDVLKAFNVWKKTKKDADRRVLAEAILDHVGRQEIVNADTGKRIPFTSEGFASVLKHASTDGAVYGKARFLVGLAAFLKDAVEIYHEPAEVPTFHTFVAPIVDDKTGKRVYGIATISGTTRLKVYDLNVYTPGGKESVGSGGQKNVAHMTGAKDLNSAVPNTKILLKTIFENQSSPTITVPELMSHVPANTALSVGERPGRAPVVEPGGDVREAGEGTLAWLRRKFVHSQTPVFEAVRRVMGVGREPPDALNVEAAAKNVHGKIRARQEMLQRAYLEPLKAILAQPGLDRKRFDDYALALHALERNRMIQERSVVVDPTTGEVVDLGVEAGSGVTNAWAERVIREIQRDPFAEQYKEAANILAEMNRFVLRGAVADGLLTEAQARTWMRLSPHYVPLKSGGAAPGAIHKRATGRFTRPDSVLVNSMRQAYATVRNGELNRVNKTMADWIRQYDPNGEQLGGTVPESHKHAKIKMTDPQYVPKGSAAEALLRERGIRLVETEDKGGYWVDTGVLPQALKRVVRESVPQGDDIVTFWEDGERKFIRFEGKRGRDGTAENEAARIADALNFKNVLHKEGRFWDAIRGLTRWKANVSTSWNPTFIVRNMGADVFNTANLMMIEGKYAELARTMRNYPAALRTIARLHSLRREAGDSKMERMFADVSVQSSVGDCALIVRR